MSDDSLTFDDVYGNGDKRQVPYLDDPAPGAMYTINPELLPLIKAGIEAGTITDFVSLLGVLLPVEEEE